ncbi:MAG: ribose 5-phosphate isomerase A [Acidimicrobiales bacterium]
MAFDDGQLWAGTVANEAAKRASAAQMAERLRPGEVVGVGSGSTSRLTIEALADRARAEGLAWTAVPTSLEVELTCAGFGVPVASLATARPDWSFDGADEVDPAGNLIKGRGGALLREKLVMASSPERYVVVDPTKLVDRLGTRFPVPVEVVPEAIRLVGDALGQRGYREVVLRHGDGKDGPLLTERGNYLLDARIGDIDEHTERELKAIPGVVESGLFIGFSPKVVVSG